VPGNTINFKNGNFRVVTPQIDDLSKFIVKAEKDGEAFLIDNINQSKVADYKGIKKLISEKLK
jgi:hypothetical protein